MEENIEFQEPDASDLPALEIVRRQAIEAGFSEVYDRDQFADLVAGPSTKLQDWIDSNSVTVLMMSTSFTPVCFGAVGLDPVEILALYTAPDFQGEGCGTELLRRLEKILVDSSQQEVTVKVPKNAVEFFANRGYQKVEVLESGPVSTFQMVKELSWEE